MKREEKNVNLPDYYYITMAVWPSFDEKTHITWRAINKNGKKKRGEAKTVEDAERKARLFCCA